MPPRKSAVMVPAQALPEAPPGWAPPNAAPPPDSFLAIAQRTFGVDGRRFGEAMARAYADRGWSRGELHRRSGVPESTLSAIEKGKIGDLNPIIAFAIAWALEAASPYDFVRGGDPPDGADPWFDALRKEAPPTPPAPRRAMFARILELAGNGVSGTGRGDAPGAAERSPNGARAQRSQPDEEATDDWEPGGVRARARAKGQTAGAVAVAGGSQAAVGIVVMLGRRFSRRPPGGGRRGRPRPPAPPN